MRTRSPASLPTATPAIDSATMHATTAPATRAASALPPALASAAFDRWLRRSDGRTDPAWRSLLALWSIPPEAALAQGASPCAAQLAGVLCASGKQRLSLLAQFDRPALLRLRQDGHVAWLLLRAVGSTQALVQIDGHDVIVRRAVLESALDGYVMIARVPVTLTLPIKRGDGGDGVVWLRRHLPTAPATATTYDAVLIDAVRARQRDFGLHADGVVGPETVLALLASDRDGPHLQRLPE